MWISLAFLINVSVARVTSEVGLASYFDNTLMPMLREELPIAELAWTGYKDSEDTDPEESFSTRAIREAMDGLERTSEKFGKLKTRLVGLENGTIKPEQSSALTYLLSRTSDVLNKYLSDDMRARFTVQERTGPFGGVAVGGVFVSQWLWYFPLLIGIAYVLRDMAGGRDRQRGPSRQANLVPEGIPEASGRNTLPRLPIGTR